MAGEPESLDSEESLARRCHRHWYDRLIMLSDGVFAIAMTLLALDIRAPAAGRLDDLWAGLAPQLDAYALSFLVISVYWLAHRRFLAMILTVDAPITVLNLVMLGLVGLLPAATRLVHASGPLPPHMLIYGALVVAIGIALAALWGYAVVAPGPVSPEVGPAERWYLFALILLAPPLLLLISSILRSPAPGAVPLLLAALFLIGWRMRQWVTRRLAQPAAMS
jgi:uncharacterized membrane protein